MVRTKKVAHEAIAECVTDVRYADVQHNVYFVTKLFFIYPGSNSVIVYVSVSVGILLTIIILLGLLKYLLLSRKRFRNCSPPGKYLFMFMI